MFNWSGLYSSRCETKQFRTAYILSFRGNEDVTVSSFLFRLADFVNIVSVSITTDFSLLPYMYLSE